MQRAQSNGRASVRVPLHLTSRATTLPSTTRNPSMNRAISIPSSHLRRRAAADPDDSSGDERVTGKRVRRAENPGPSSSTASPPLPRRQLEARLNFVENLIVPKVYTNALWRSNDELRKKNDELEKKVAELTNRAEGEGEATDGAAAAAAGGARQEGILWRDEESEDDCSSLFGDNAGVCSSSEGEASDWGDDDLLSTPPRRPQSPQRSQSDDSEESQEQPERQPIPPVAAEVDADEGEEQEDDGAARETDKGEAAEENAQEDSQPDEPAAAAGGHDEAHGGPRTDAQEVPDHDDNVPLAPAADGADDANEPMAPAKEGETAAEGDGVVRREMPETAQQHDVQKANEQRDELPRDRPHYVYRSKSEGARPSPNSPPAAIQRPILPPHPLPLSAQQLEALQELGQGMQQIFGDIKEEPAEEEAEADAAAPTPAAAAAATPAAAVKEEDLGGAWWRCLAEPVPLSLPQHRRGTPGRPICYRAPTRPLPTREPTPEGSSIGERVKLRLRRTDAMEDAEKLAPVDPRQLRRKLNFWL